MIKVCIVGAGAIGGFIGTRLAAAGIADLSAIARGEVLASLRSHGWRMNTAAGLVSAPARASSVPEEFGVQDLVVIAVKGPALPGLARSIGPLLGSHTLVMPAMNGVPWWFCRDVPGIPGGALNCIDPEGLIAGSIPFENVLGCVVHASTATPEPGLVQHRMGQGLIIGEPRGGRSDRAEGVTRLMAEAGFDTTHSANIRHDIWYKLWGNLTMNPVSAITGATMDRVLADPLVRRFCSAVMGEAAAIGRLIGCPIEQSAEDRHAITARLGAVKTSMLQDVEAGRQIELDAIVTAVQEIGVHLGQPTPNLDALLGMARLFGRVHALYPEAAQEGPK